MRGESERVAARVRELLGHGEPKPAVRSATVAGQPTALTARAGWWQRVLARVPVQLDPGRRAAAGVGLAVLAAAVLTGLWLVVQRPRAVPVSAGGDVATTTSLAPGLPGATAGSASRGGAVATAGPSASVRAAASAAPVVVDVAGKVRRPGLYRLPEGARVDDAVRAAGGSLRGVDLSSLNLAARVVDGQQILVGNGGGIGGGVGVGGGAGVGGPGAAPGAAMSRSAVAGGTAAAMVNLNSATLDQLESLPGIGPVLAQHILDWRTQHGQFATVDQLQDVSGIGPAKFAALKGLVGL
jgi:competence protein ComEA